MLIRSALGWRGVPWGRLGDSPMSRFPPPPRWFREAGGAGGGGGGGGVGGRVGLADR